MTRGTFALVAVYLTAALLLIFGLEPAHIVIRGDDAPAVAWQVEKPPHYAAIAGGSGHTCLTAVTMTGGSTAVPVYVPCATSSGATAVYTTMGPSQ